ncbi:protein kinase [Nocardia sp. CDC153]|uniref:serine/threonine-protein kinase n=1 Tax=Nocardia sp. CDC153 TaxID=3112167 RepID=UPI002DBD9E56|nr:protein kinase [Nocardia sp. CDC153]MEC3954796.1 protein kinase [Nocardia sp. CDC153]
MGDRRFGPYRLENLLGNGGTGQVWRAHDTRTERTVALKLLARELAADDTYRQRFRREARTAARLHEPHVVPIHTFGEHDGQLFIDMAYVDGSDLGKLLRADGPLPPTTAIDIVSQVAGALDGAHRNGLVHRDVKPSNIIVMPSGFTYLIDFGTVHQTGQATLTGSSLVIGTPAYMAPERFTGTATARSDIYSLACVLYESLTGRRPFPDNNPVAQMHAHLTADPPHLADVNPALPGELDHVIARALAKDPEQRFETAGEFAAAARTALTRASASATTPIPAAPAPTKRLPPIPPGSGEDPEAAGLAVAAHESAPVPDRVLGREEGAAAAVVPPGSILPGPTRAETARRTVFPRRFAAAVAVAAVVVGAGSGWAVWHAGHRSDPTPVRTTQAPAPAGTPSDGGTTTEAPRHAQTTAPANPYTAPPSSTVESPPASTVPAPAPQPSTAAPQPNPTVAPTTLPFPFPQNFTPPGQLRPTADKPGNGQGNDERGGKPPKPTKVPD